MGKATKELSDINNLDYDVGFVFEVVNNNTTVCSSGFISGIIEKVIPPKLIP